MKTIMINAIGILLLLSIISCTEEIAEEVQNKEAVTSDGSVNLASKSIRLVHKMDEKLSYVMHKAGSTEQGCELKTPGVSGFSADDYDYTSASYTADCVLDVEELDLMQNGLDIEIQVDDNLCEYVGYLPYSFYRFQPGRTSRNVYKVQCEGFCAEDADTAALCDNTYDDYNSGAATIQARVYNAIPESEPMCFYDWASKYTTGGDDYPYPNCDVGKVNVYTITYTPNAGDTDCTTALRSDDFEEQECGGNVFSCKDGALKEEAAINSSEGRTMVVYDNTQLDSFTQNWSYEGKFTDVSDGNFNWKYANYSRYCADDSLKTSDAATDVAILTGSDVEQIRGIAGSTTYTAFTADASDTTNGGSVEGTSYAENLFRGRYSVMPYYAFVCFDKAYDVKAQIRLFVRDWDKMFDNTNAATLTVNSDSSSLSSKMDLDDATQGGTGSLGTKWNDFDDLDDFFRDSDGAGANMWTQGQCTTTAVTTDNAATTTINERLNNFPGHSMRYRSSN